MKGVTYIGIFILNALNTRAESRFSEKQGISFLFFQWLITDSKHRVGQADEYILYIYGYDIRESRGAKRDVPEKNNF